MEQVDLLENTTFGSNVTELADGGECKIMRLQDKNGEGIMTLYQVFPGISLMYSDFHMSSCISEFSANTDLLCIDHCREGRMEQEIMDGAYCYLQAGDLRVDRRLHHSGRVEFPLCHYHGISISFEMEQAALTLKKQVPWCSVDLTALQKKYCETGAPFVVPGEPTIEHIFSELYAVPIKIKRDYFRIKILELLLYLDALELSDSTEERPYFYKAQVEKIKAIHRKMTGDLTRHQTLEQLAREFDIALTPMKNCFRSVYGSPVYRYMRVYRMNCAAALLRKERAASVAEIAGMVGYDSPSKFSSAFKAVMGTTPMEYRKDIR